VRKLKKIKGVDYGKKPIRLPIDELSGGDWITKAQENAKESAATIKARGYNVDFLLDSLPMDKEVLDPAVDMRREIEGMTYEEYKVIHKKLMDTHKELQEVAEKLFGEGSKRKRLLAITTQQLKNPSRVTEKTKARNAVFRRDCEELVGELEEMKKAYTISCAALEVSADVLQQKALGETQEKNRESDVGGELVES